MLNAQQDQHLPLGLLPVVKLSALQAHTFRRLDVLLAVLDLTPVLKEPQHARYVVLEVFQTLKELLLALNVMLVSFHLLEQPLAQTAPQELTLVLQQHQVVLHAPQENSLILELPTASIVVEVLSLTPQAAKTVQPVHQVNILTQEPQHVLNVKLATSRLEEIRIARTVLKEHMLI